MEKAKKRWFLTVFAVIGFVVTLYLVDVGSFSSSAVAEFNNGYGTFDMKSYTYEKVNRVLAGMDAEGISVYQKYYVADFLFIIFFGLLQCIISAFVFKNNASLFKKAAIGVSIARGVFDIVENIILLVTITSYPKTSSIAITAASISTQCKLWCIRIWVVMILAGIIYTMYIKLFRKK